MNKISEEPHMLGSLNIFSIQLQTKMQMNN